MLHPEHTSFLAGACRAADTYDSLSLFSKLPLMPSFSSCRELKETAKASTFWSCEVQEGPYRAKIPKAQNGQCNCFPNLRSKTHGTQWGLLPAQRISK